MKVIGVRTGAVFSTERIFCRSALVMNLVNQSVLQECFECSVECGSVRPVKRLFKI